jgi:phosphate transport system substrate-binding protein
MTRNLSAIACLLLFTAVAWPDEAGTASPSVTSPHPLRQVMESVVLPEVDFRAAHILDIVHFYAEASREYDRSAGPGAHKGVNMVLTLPPLPPAPDVPLLTFRAKDITLDKALDLTVKLANLECDYETNWVHLHPAGVNLQGVPGLDAATPEGQALIARLKAIVIPELDARQADIADLVNFLNGALERCGRTVAAARDFRLQVNLQGCSPNGLPTVTLDALRGLSLFDVLRLVTYQTQTDCTPCAGGVCLRITKLDQPLAQPPGVANARQLTPGTYPCIGGPKSTRPLRIAAACRLLGSDCAWDWDDLRPVAVLPPGTSPLDPAYRKRQETTGRVANLVDRDNGGSLGFADFVYGRCDMLVTDRALTDEDRALARARGVAFEIQPVARDALVFVVHPDNPVTNLTLDQLRGIYRGEIRNWKDVGGPDADLRAFEREKGSREREMLCRLVMQGRDPVRLPGLIMLGMGGGFNRVISDAQGLGYSAFYDEERNAARIRMGDSKPCLKFLAVAGVLPTRTTIGRHEYPCSSEVHAVTRIAGAPSAATLLRDWLRSPEGQACVTESGFIPLGASGG